MPHVKCFLCGTSYTVSKDEYRRLMEDMSVNRMIICRTCEIARLTKEHHNAADENKDLIIIHCPKCGKRMVCIFLSHGDHQVTYTYTCSHHASAKLTIGYSY